MEWITNNQEAPRTKVAHWARNLRLLMTGAAMGSMVLAGASPVAAAVDPSFAAAVTNPFGFADVGAQSSPTFADIDHDGDYDAFVGNYDGIITYFQNTGTATAPAFAAGVTSPFGLTDIGFENTPRFIDLDNDGDLDGMIGKSTGHISYAKNNGSASAPTFAAPVANSFGMSDPGTSTRPDFVDIDGDGDLDGIVGDGSGGGFVYFQNTGTATAPAFAAAVSNPFGLTTSGASYAAPSFADIDLDGDLDVFIGNNLGSTRFLRNTGTTTAPAFAAPVLNPFGLTSLGGNAAPALVDIDADGDIDVFFGDTNGNITYFQNNATPPTPTAPPGTPTFTPTRTATHTPTQSPTPTVPPPATCPPSPSGICKTSVKAQLALKLGADPAKFKLSWDFKNGPLLSQSSFGNPTGVDSFALCLFENGAPKMEASIASSSTLWVPSSTKGYKYKDKAGTTSDGITAASLLGGADGKSKIAIDGKGAALPMPTPASPSAVFASGAIIVSQLHQTNGDCYEATFSATQIKKNDGVQFKAKK